MVWGGEFGRTPFNEKGDGRDHNPWGFTMWMAGGGVKGGQYLGTTDEIGLRARENAAPRPRYPRVHLCCWVSTTCSSHTCTTAAPNVPPSSAAG